MPKLSGNKGEWSEIYVFLRLLEVGKLYAADADLNKMDDVFYNIINIVRTENIGVLEFRVDRNAGRVSVYNTETAATLIADSASEWRYSLHGHLPQPSASWSHPYRLQAGFHAGT